MKKFSFILVLFCLFIFACDTTQNNNAEDETTTTIPPETIEETSYSNDRFKNVQVERISPDTYMVSGTAQVFEATLSYVVEDGHYELTKGFTTTDAGAPEFGNFEFTVNVEKNQPNSTLMLILFESSPKDGSRTHELIIPMD